MPTRLPLIDLLARGGSFNARRLSLTVPLGVLDALSKPVRAFMVPFFAPMGNGFALNLDTLINDQWRQDPTRVRHYRSLSSNARLEFHVLAGFVLHETIHQADLLASPFGLSYLTLLVEEYHCLQTFIPEILDQKAYEQAFPLLDHVGKSIPRVVTHAGLEPDWLRLEEIIRKTIAWGDIGGRTPKRSEVALGWEEDFARAGYFYGTTHRIEPIRVFDFSFWSFRLEGDTVRYLTPTAILETKALAGTMLYILEIAPNMRDVWRHFDSVYYYNRETLKLDYLLLFDIIAEHHGFLDFGHLLRSGNRSTIRSALLLAQSFCWFGLQAPPLLGGHERGPSLGGNPVVRLFTALASYGGVLAAWHDPVSKTGTELMDRIEQQQIFAGLDQMPVAEVHARCLEAMDRIDDRIAEIWHPDVRAYFARRLAMMRPVIEEQGPSYNSRIGQPENGNARPRAGKQIEIFYHDHAPTGGYAEWLDLRDEILFKHVPLDGALIDRLHAHFEAPMAIVPCKHCGGLHQFTASRFAERQVFHCPATGAAIEIVARDVQRIRIGAEGEEPTD